MLQSRWIRIATGAPWYVGKRQLHEDLGVPFFADHIRALTESFDSKLADAGNSLVRQVGKDLRWPRVDLSHPKRKPRMMMANRPVEAARKTVARSTKRIVPSIFLLGTFRLPWLSVSRHFFSVATQMPGFNTKTEHGPLSPSRTVASQKCLPTVACLRLRLRQSGFEAQEAFKPKYAPNKLINKSLHAQYANLWSSTSTRSC
jgi:hypothetical protein